MALPSLPLLDDSAFGLLRNKGGKGKKLRIIGFDSEDDTKGTPLMFTFHDGTKGYTFKQSREAIRFMVEYPEEAIFCAHNLEYDVGNLFKDTNFKQVDRMIYASRLLRVSLKFSKNFMLNSQSFFPGGVRAMGEVVGLKKLEGNALSQEYGERDAEIVQRFMARLQDSLYSDFEAPLGISIGQVSMDVYRRAFMPFKKLPSYNHMKCLKAFYGGRVEMFYKGLCKGPIKVIDFNSCYPYVMENRDYPDTSRLVLGGIDELKHGIGRFTMLVPEDTFVPPLPWRSPGGRLFFPTGIFTGWWTFEEVRMAMTLGAKIVREWEGVGTNYSLRPFNGFVQHFYMDREIAKKTLKENAYDENALFRSFYDKAMMNNCFGKLIMHKPGNTMTRTPLPESFLEKNPDIKRLRHGPFWSYTIPRQKPPPTANYMWGLYITSYARQHLLSHMVKVHEAGATLIYCDTDSIMYTGEVKGLSIGTALGELSEETFDLGVFRQSKGYLLCKNHACTLKDKMPEYRVEKVACKGVGTSYALDFIVKGMTYVLKPIRLKEALIRVAAGKSKSAGRLGRELGINVWDEVRKEMLAIYIKRKGDSGITQPVNVSEISSLEENTKATAESFEETLAPFRLEAKDLPSTAFLDIRIPPNWFADGAKAPKVEAPGLPHRLSAREVESLSVGECWVAGIVQAVDQGKYGNSYRIAISVYLDSPCASENMLGLIPVKYFSGLADNLNLIGKKVELYLASEYIPKRAVNLRIEVSD